MEKPDEPQNQRTMAHMNTDLKALLVHQLAKLYYAENQLVRALKMMSNAATEPALKAAFLAHRVETKGHVDRIAATFPELNENVQAHTCQAIEGLLENGKWMIHTMKPGATLDIALIGAAQQVELFELASYRNVIGLAKQLRSEKVAELCEGILCEELEADSKLTEIARDLGQENSISLALENVEPSGS